MSVIHINIGSNTGDRAALIERAVAALSERIDPAGRAQISLAPIEESEAWGFESDNRFLNLGVMIESPDDFDPLALLDLLQSVEKDIADVPHRNPDGSYADRPIDIDLIAVDDKVVDEARLKLPHPRMHLRPFVLEPIKFLDPDWRHPIIGLTADEMLKRVL